MQLSGWISVLLVIVLVVHVSVAHVTGRRYGGRSGGIRQKVRGGGRGGGSGSAYGGTRESFDGTRDSFDGTRDSFDGTRDSFDGTRVTFDGTRDSFDGRSSGFGGSSTVKDSSVNTGRGYSSSNRGDGISTYSKGTGRGSIARSSTFKSAIAGAAAGYITYQAGKAIINTAGAAMMWRGRPYYWGPSYYQYRSSYEMCSISLINSTDDLFSNVFFSNMTRPTQIVWSCRAFYDSCCGYECCPRNNSGVIYWIIIGM
uniref:CX domain-containing protein n=1 Tax=Plectus sambesii TaxID=2011161 RepID=A0A914W8U9_9BILA